MARRADDDVDRAVVTCLMRDARSTYAEIGSEVGLSAPAVKRRVDRLVSSGTIRGFTAIVDAEARGWTTEAYVELHCKGTVAPSELRRGLEKVPEIDRTKSSIERPPRSWLRVPVLAAREGALD